MRFSTVVAFALSAIAVSARGYNNGTGVIVTEIVTQYTTYCPFATTVVENNKTYIVTEATILTIPRTRTQTYTTVTSSVCPGGCGAPHGTGVPYGTGALPAATPPTYNNATGIVKPTSKPTNSAASGNSTSPSATPSSPPYQGSANKATVAAGALAGLIGVAAYLL